MREIQVILSMLTIVDNPVQEISLAAAMMSYFGGFTAAELGMVRKLGREHADKNTHNNLYEHLKAVAVLGGADKIQETDVKQLSGKCALFLAKLTEYRDKSSVESLYDLCWEMIYDSGYYDYVGTMPAGTQRQANLNVLLERAAGYGKSSYSGLFNFLRYIERLKKFDEDFAEGAASLDNENLVRIMSIHKSKGLEFPVVFAAGMGKQFNTQDTKSSMILHPEWGIGIDKIDLKRRTKAPTFLKKLIREEAMYEMWAEEMRILYVALTRAKEKLIMTGVLPDRFIMRSGKDGVITAGAKSYFDWIIPALWSEEEEAALEDAPVCIFQYTGNDIGADILQVKSEQLALDVLKHWDVTKVYDPEIRKCLDEQADYVYPYYSEGGMKMKFTVSELKKRKALQEEAGEEMYKEPQTVPLLPRFIKEEETLSGASRGSAYHKFLELLDFAKEYEADDLEAEVERLAEDGRLSREMAECIETEDMMRFLRTKSGVRMLQAARNRKLYKEQPFVISVNASEIYQGDLSGEKILVQGIIDVYFEEEDGLVVLDYKTDQVKSRKELVEKYHAQLEYYAHALSQLTGKTVKEKIIYSFTLKEEIIV